jgi:hypothetical protein
MTSATTGRVEEAGPNRTPRSEIQPTRTEGKKYEPDVAIDFSDSMFWSSINERDRSQDYPHSNSRRAVLEGFLPLYLNHLAQFDSAAQDNDEEGELPGEAGGGVWGVGFSGHAFKLRDLNLTNVARKLEEAWIEARKHPGTVVGPAMKLLDEHFDEEFPGDTTRIHETSLFTDGEPSDPETVLGYIHGASETRKYLIGILGHGTAALATYNLYKDAAKENKARTGTDNVHVILFDAVTDPVIIAKDMATLAS